jgi:hypothetical protein
MYAASLHPTTSLLVDGVKTAVQLQLYTPTNTILGHVTPFECSPNLKWLRIYMGAQSIYALNHVARITRVHNPVHHSRSNHVDVKFHWLRERMLLDTTLLLLSTSSQQSSWRISLPIFQHARQLLPSLCLDYVRSHTSRN